MSKEEIRFKLDMLLESCFALGAYDIAYGSLLFACNIGAITNDEWLYLRRACHIAECSFIEEYSL